MRTLKNTTVLPVSKSVVVHMCTICAHLLNILFTYPKLNNTTFSIWKNNFYNVYLRGINKIKIVCVM